MAEKPWIIEEQDQRLLLIGSICAQWSHYEYQFACIIWKLLRIGPETGKIVTGGLDMMPRARMALNLARHLKAPRPLIKALVTAREEIQDKLDTRRNQAVHGVQFLSEDEKSLQIEVHRGRGGREKQELTLEALRLLSRDIFQSSEKLQIVSVKILWPDWPEASPEKLPTLSQIRSGRQSPGRTRKTREPPPPS